MELIKKLFLPITAPIAFIQRNFKAVVLVLIVVAIVASSDKPKEEPNLYRIDLFGPIFEAEKFLAEVENAKKSTIKGVLLVVDSPGGGVPQSVEMMMAIKDLSQMKPVVAYASGTMASGSYYASIYSDEIIANPGSIIGSIGVIMQGANIEKLLENIGVKFNTVKAGEYKEAGAFYREWTEEERSQLQKVISETYDMFTKDVAEARGLDVSQKSRFADGKIFTALSAYDVGLIDRLGSFDQAKYRTKELAEVDRAIWNEKDEFEKFLQIIKEESRAFVYSLVEPKAVF